MGTLDKNKPYGLVYGLPGVAYEQNKKSYNSRGDEVYIDENGEVQLKKDPEIASPVVEVPETPVVQPSERPFSSLMALTKEEIISELTIKGVEFNPTASRLTLLKLLRVKKGE